MPGVLYARVGTEWVPVVGGGIGENTIEEVWPAGSIRATIKSTADPGWLLFGQTVAGAQTLYPALWAVAPAGWKSGANLVIPSDVDCGLRGSSVAGLGQTSGTNTKTLAEANLPPHAHNINHGHGTALSGTDTANHSHAGVDHLHRVDIWSAGINQNHYHGGLDGQHTIIHAYASGIGYAGGGNQLGAGTTHWVSHDHAHAVNGVSGAADRGLQTGGVSSWHQHYSDIPAHAGGSGNTGSGAAVNVQDAAINVRFQIKAH